MKRRGFTCECGAWFGWTRHFQAHQRTCPQIAPPPPCRPITAEDVERVFAEKERSLLKEIAPLKRKLARLGMDLHALHVVRADWRRAMKRRAK